MRAWDVSHDVDADLLRDLLRGRNITDPDPRGLRLRGARIRGCLDLDRLATSIVLELEDRLLDQGLRRLGSLAHIAAAPLSSPPTLRARH
jgi:hypothetical protein